MKLIRTLTYPAGEIQQAEIKIHGGSLLTFSNKVTNTIGPNYGEGVLTQSINILVLVFTKANGYYVAVNLAPLHNGQSNEEWFKAVDSRILAVEKAFKDKYPAQPSHVMFRVY